MKRLSSVLALVALPLLLAACDGRPITQGEETAVEKQQSWSLLHLTSYEYTLQRSCFCISPHKVNITVENGAIVRVVDVENGNDIGAANYQDWPTIDELFTTILSALNGGAEEVRITYDPRYAFPVSAYIDYIRQAADDEIGYEVSAFSAR